MSAGDILVLVLAAIEEVRCVNCGEDGPGALEWIGAAAGLIGGVAAVIALVLARSSAAHAERSAAAAEAAAKAAERTASASEEEVALTRDEVAAARAERSRRAEIVVELAIAGTTAGGDDELLLLVEFSLGLKNVGTRTAPRVVLNVLVPAGVALEAREQPAWVQHSQTASTPADDLGRGPEACVYWNGIVGPIDPDNSYKVYNLVLHRPPAGRIPVLVKVNQPDSAGDALSLWEVEVPAGGRAVTVRKVRDPKAATLRA